MSVLGISIDGDMLNAMLSQSGRLAQGETKEYMFGFFAVQKAPAPREQGHAQACVKNHYQTNKPKTAQRSKAERECCGRVRRLIKVYIIMACLRGPVNGGAEKRNGS